MPRSTLAPLSFFAILVGIGCAAPPAQSPTSSAATASDDPAAAPAPSADVAPPQPSAAPGPAPAPAACPHDTSAPVQSTSGTIKIGGCLNPTEIDGILKVHARAMHDCYAAEAKVNRKAKGKVNIRISVGQKGVYGVRVLRSEIDSEGFVQCLVGVLESMAMPKPQGGPATVEYETTF